MATTKKKKQDPKEPLAPAPIDKAAEAIAVAEKKPVKSSGSKSQLVDAPPKPGAPTTTPEEDAADAAAEEGAIAEETAPTPKAPAPAKKSPSRKKAAPPTVAGAIDTILGKDDTEQRRQTQRERAADRLFREQQRNMRTAAHQKFWGAISAFQEAAKRHQILRGVVSSVERLSSDDSASNAQTVVMIGLIVNADFKVLVPFEEFFRDNPIDMDSVSLTTKQGRDDYFRRQRQMAEKMYGAEVDFCVTEVIANSVDEYYITGSRKSALEIMEARNYLPIRGGEPAIVVGDICQARILSVGQYSLWVTVEGVDLAIPLRDLTYQYTTNLNDRYAVGDTIDIEITEINTRSSDNHILLVASAKGAELDEAKRRQRAKLLPVGASTTGTITSIRQSKRFPDKIIIHAWLDHYKMPAVVRAMDPAAISFTPQAGDSLRLSVIGFTDSGFVQVTCHGSQNAQRRG